MFLRISVIKILDPDAALIWPNIEEYQEFICNFHLFLRFLLEYYNLYQNDALFLFLTNKQNLHSEKCSMIFLSILVEVMLSKYPDPVAEKSRILRTQICNTG